MAFYKQPLATVTASYPGQSSYDGPAYMPDPTLPKEAVRIRQPRPRKSNFTGSNFNPEYLYYGIDAGASLTALQTRVTELTAKVSDLSTKLEAAQTIAAFTSNYWKSACAGKTGLAWQLCNNVPTLLSDQSLVAKAKLIGLNPGSGNTASEDFANAQVPVLQGQLNSARSDLNTATAQLNAAMGTAAQSDPGSIAARGAAQSAVIKAQSTAFTTKYLVLGGGIILFAGVLFLIFRK